MTKKTVLFGARIWDGISGELKEASILIEGRKIKDVLYGGGVPEGYAPVDLTGKIVMPGLFDMHGHFYGRVSTAMESLHEAYCPLYLAGGITTVRTPGEFEPVRTWNWKQDIENEQKIGPRILTAGAYFDRERSTVHWIKGKTTEREFRRQYEEQLPYVDFVKCYCSMRKEDVKRIVGWAHADGLKAYAHLGNCSAYDALDVGLDGLEHGFFTMCEFYGGPDPNINEEALLSFDPYGKEADRVIGKIIETDAAITPTIITFMLSGPAYEKRIDDVDGWRYVDPDLIEFQHERRQKMLRGEDPIGTQDRLIEKQYQFVSRIVEAGGRVFAGTDPSYPLIVPGHAIVWEAENLTHCAMTNLQILRALTIEAAKEMKVDGITGSLEAGKEADLCILTADPLEDVKNLASVCGVCKGGRMFDSAELRESAVGAML